jgi:hypothetical protein
MITRIHRRKLLKIGHDQLYWTVYIVYIVTRLGGKRDDNTGL